MYAIGVEFVALCELGRCAMHRTGGVDERAVEIDQYGCGTGQPGVEVAGLAHYRRGGNPTPRRGGLSASVNAHDQFPLGTSVFQPFVRVADVVQLDHLGDVNSRRPAVQ